MRVLFGLGPELRETAEVFVANKTKAATQEHAEHLASLSQLGKEFTQAPGGWFNDLINGMNRVPRPALALGTIGLFAFAMADPVAFGIRMQGLALVPEPLWWLLGAIVSFYFGARELHYFRGGKAGVAPGAVADTLSNIEALQSFATPEAIPDPEPVAVAQPIPAVVSQVTVPIPANDTGGETESIRVVPAVDNPALAEWQALQR